MKHLFKRLLVEESGMEMLEWAVVGALIVAVAAGAFSLVGAEVNDRVGDLVNVFGN